jgi:hypothetical protein
MEVGSLNGADLQQRLFDMLIGKIKEETYPSVTMMNRVEESLQSPEQAEEYAEVLFEKVEATRYPSISMLDRLDRLATLLVYVAAYGRPGGDRAAYASPSGDEAPESISPPAPRRELSQTGTF